MSRVAVVGYFVCSLVADRGGLPQHVVHEGRHGETTKRCTGFHQEIVHADRGGDEACAILPPRAAAKRRDADNPLDPLPPDRIGGGPGEVEIGCIERLRRIGRREPEQRSRAVERPVDGRAIAVRSLDDLDAVANGFVHLARIAHHDPDLGVGLEQVVDDMVADLSGRCGHDYHAGFLYVTRRRSQRRVRISPPVTAASAALPLAEAPRPAIGPWSE